MAVLGVLFTVGNHLKGLSVKKYLPAFLGLFLLAVLPSLLPIECHCQVQAVFLQSGFWSVLLPHAVLLIVLPRVPGLRLVELPARFFADFLNILLDSARIFSYKNPQKMPIEISV